MTVADRARGGEVINPYGVLGLKRDAGDAEIRKRYLELVRAHPPGRDPKAFQQIARAYEAIKSPEARVESHLFGWAHYKTFDQLLADMETALDLGGELPGLRDLIGAEGLADGKPRR